MDVASNGARSRAHKILGLVLERYLTSGAIETELVGESLTVIKMVKTELLKIRDEIVLNNLDSPEPLVGHQTVAQITNKRNRLDHPNAAKPARIE